MPFISQISQPWQLHENSGVANIQNLISYLK